MKHEYDQFANLLLAGCAAFADKAAYRNALVYTRVELESLTEVSKKNAVIFLQKSIKLIYNQIEWMEK